MQCDVPMVSDGACKREGLCQTTPLTVVLVTLQQHPQLCWLVPEAHRWLNAAQLKHCIMQHQQSELCWLFLTSWGTLTSAWQNLTGLNGLC